MSYPRLTAAPTAADFAHITDPIRRAAAIGEVARQHGTLTTDLAGARVAALREARSPRVLDDGTVQPPTPVVEIADKVGISPSRICQLTGTPSGHPDMDAEPRTVPSDPASTPDAPTVEAHR